MQCSAIGNIITLYDTLFASIGTLTCTTVGLEAITSSALADGTNRIRYTDTDPSKPLPNESGFSLRLVIRIDNQAPTAPSVSLDTLTNGIDDPIITFSATDNLAIDFYTVEYIQDNNAALVSATTTTISPATSPVTLDLDPDEITASPFFHTITVTAYDQAGNSTITELKFPPVITFTAPTTLSNLAITDTTFTISSPGDINDITNIVVTGGTGFTCLGAGADATDPYTSPVTCSG